jgi:hypothetical protein
MKQFVRLIALSTLAARTAAASETVVLVPPASSGWRAKNVPHDEIPSFAGVAFDDGSWQTSSSPFANSDLGCGYTSSTDWPLNTDMLVRRLVFVPAPSVLQISVAVDNDVQVFLNGMPVGDRGVYDGCDSTFRHHKTVDVPMAGSYLLAVRGIDRGGASYLDVKVEATMTADCNNDGIVDYGQILQGQLSDLNTDGVPDVCQQPTCADADIFRDFNVNGADLGILLSQWGLNTPLTVSDINGDGVVSGADLGLLLANWGPCPD